MLSQRRILAISIVFNVLLIGGVILLYEKNVELIGQNQHLSSSVAGLETKESLLKNQLTYYQSQVDFYSRLAASSLKSQGLSGRAIVNIVAVTVATSSDFQEYYQGETMEAVIELESGTGRILVNTEPQIGIDLQASTRTASLVAENVTGKNLSGTDIILNIYGSKALEVVDGPSAGAAITTAIIAALENRTLNQQVFISGTMNPDGSIGKVGGLPEKALAVAQKGAVEFLVPKGQSEVSVLQAEQTQPFPGVTVVTYKQVQVNLQDYLKSNGFNTKVMEVDNINQAFQYLTQP